MDDWVFGNTKKYNKNNIDRINPNLMVIKGIGFEVVTISN